MLFCLIKQQIEVHDKIQVMELNVVAYCPTQIKPWSLMDLCANNPKYTEFSLLFSIKFWQYIQAA